MYLLRAQGLPEVITVQVIRVGVVVVVSEFPTRIREENRAHAERSNDLVDSAVLSKALVSAVVANNKEARGGSSEEDPAKWEEIPGKT